MGPRAVPLPVFEAARRGDRSAIVLLLEITKPDIHRFARKSCRTSADAEEATQEAMWALFRRIGTIRSLATFSGWLFTVVRRECLRLAQRANPSRHAPIDEVDLSSVLAARSDVELCLDIAAAIEALPPHYRDVALMRDIREDHRRDRDGPWRDAANHKGAPASRAPADARISGEVDEPRARRPIACRRRC